jgi:hypothetical protein
MGQLVKAVPFREKARRTTDLGGAVNHNSHPFRRDHLASPAALYDASNYAVFVVFDTTGP